ncbi:hypothetical protein, partial [Ralstonia syzygii]|uniref:hypothetical protein n=1 Tax=Ralstonia syzygii TaxID=28097 RepID=UPI00359348E4
VGMIGRLASTGNQKHETPRKPVSLRAFSLLRSASAGNMTHPQARFFYGMANGIIWIDAMTGARYHATTFRRFMVSKSHKPLIYKG